MLIMFITSEKENFKVCTTGGAKIRSQNKLTSLFMSDFQKNLAIQLFITFWLSFYQRIQKWHYF